MNSHNDVILFLNSIYFPNHRILQFIEQDLLNSFIGVKQNTLSNLKFLSESEYGKIYSKIFNFKIDRYIHQLNLNSIKFTTIIQEDYPEILKKIHNPPAILFYKGSLDIISNNLAVVGSRKASDYGIWATKKIISQLKGLNISIVSGMARGIDRQAHLSAIDNKINTIGVLASSIDIIYPSSNRDLYNLMEGQLLISEYGLNSYPLKHNFVSRNRIISGLSFATLVVEAEEKSGSLITANYAIEQAREVFAVPGRIGDIKSQGCNNLISKGAKILVTASDIIDELPYLSELNSLEIDYDNLSLSDLQLSIVKVLGDRLMSFDKLMSELNVDLSTLYRNLIKLEMEGVLIRTNGNYFSLRI